MSLAAQFKILFKIMKLRVFLILTVVYSIIYGLIFGLLAGRGLKAAIFQTLVQMIFFMFTFLGTAFGSGILSTFYMMTSFGWERKKIFKLWSKAIWLNLLIGGLLSGLLVLVGISLNADTRGALNLLPWLTINWMAKPGVLAAMLLLGMGCSLLLMLLIAFFCVLGGRYGWQITVGAILLALALFLVTFVANINILVMTGCFLYHYLAGVYVASALLYTAIYFLSQKLEVKS